MKGCFSFFFLSFFFCMLAWSGRRRRNPARRKEETQPARRPCGFAIRRQKRFDLFNADLKSASSENAQRRHEKPAAADCKSAIKRSSLFCLRIANPQERLADSSFSLTPSGLEFLLNA